MKGCFCHFNGYEVKDAAARAAIKNNEDQIAVERNRINQLASLPDGSTAGDAELQDIRIGYDGTVYATAGEAVRGQFAKVAEDAEGALKGVMSKNLFDKTKITAGRYINTDGSLGWNSSYSASDYIEVEPNTTYTVHNMFTHAQYDSDKRFISEPDANNGTFTTAENARFFRFGMHNDFVETQQMERGSEKTEYQEYGVVVPEDKISADISLFGAHVKFLLPDTVYLRPGENFSVYYENVIKNFNRIKNSGYYVAQMKKDGNTLSNIGNAYDYKWDITPTAGDAFDVVFRVVRECDEAMICEKTVHFVVAPVKTGISKNIVIMGDSFVDGYGITEKLVSNIAKSGNNVVSLGVNATNDPNIFDCAWSGYSLRWVTHSAAGSWLRKERALSDAVWDAGWGENEEYGWKTGATYGDLTWEQITHGNTRNEFYNPATETFDFGYYMSKYHPGKLCDIFISEYGLNDIGWSTRAECVAALQDLKNFYDAIIASAKSFNPNIKIILYTIVPSGIDNNCIGVAFRSFPHKDRVNGNIKLFNEMLLNNFQNIENVYVVPSNANFDQRYGIRTGAYTPVKFDKAIVEEHTIDIHPSDIGAEYISDTLANMVYYLL